MSTVLLGIDPGPTQSGVCIFDGKRALFAAVMDNSELLDAIMTLEFGHFVLPPLGFMACERIVAQGQVVAQETFDTAHYSGRFVQAWGDDDSCDLIPRREVLKHILGQPRAKVKGKADAEVRAALIERFGAPGTKAKPGNTYGVASHAWQAMAVAVTAYDRLQEG